MSLRKLGASGSWLAQSAVGAVVAVFVAGCGARSALDCLGETCALRGDGATGVDRPDAGAGVGSDDDPPPVTNVPPRPRPDPEPEPEPGPPPDEPSNINLCGSSGRLFQSLTVQSASDLTLLEGCREVDGDLTLALVTDDLSELSQLQRVTGTLTLSMTGSLNGLDNLQYVGNLALSELDTPTLAPFSNLRQIGSSASGGSGYLTITALRTVTNLVGLGAIQSLISIDINAAGSLTSLVGLAVPGAMQSITIADSPVLTDLQGFEGLVQVEDLALNGMLVTTLAGFDNLQEVGSLALIDSPVLTDISALASLTNVRVLYVQNVGLSNLSGLPSLRSLGSAILQFNPNLVDVDALGALQELSEISAIQNPSLVRLPELLAVTDLQQIVIDSNPVLATGPSFPNAGHVEILTVADNPSLSALTGFARVQSARNIVISRNALLTDVNLSALTDARRLNITCNASLPEASVEPLRVVGRQVNISGNQGSASPCAGSL